MLTYRPLVVLLVSVAAHHLGAQQAPPTSTHDTLTIVGARPNQAVRLTITGDVAVTILGPEGGSMTADTMIVTTPVRLELARKPFSMVISAATPDSAAIMLVRPTITPQPGGPVVNYKFSLPVYLSRVGTDSTLTVSSDGMVMERAP